MSEHTLPDDPSQWPHDPYELLGVPHGVSERELKKAYARLLRLYKPEHAPAEFRRIREAYEFIQQDIAGAGPMVFRPEPQRPRPEPVPCEAPDTDVQQDAEARPILTTAEIADAWWLMACHEDVVAAYAGMVALADLGVAEPLLYAQLYWLLLLHPELDRTRQPWAWLWLGLERGPLEQTLLTLLLQAGQARPALLLTPQARRLLHVDNVDWLASYVGQRWSLLLQQEAYGAIILDLEHLHASPLRDAGPPWLSALMVVLDWVCWEDDDEARHLRTLVRQEMQHLPHSYWRHSQTAERVDYGVELVQDCHNIPDELALVRTTIRDLWRQSEEEARRALEALFDAVDQAPQQWIASFDTLCQEAPFAFNCLYSTVLNFANAFAEADETPPPQLWVHARQAIQHAEATVTNGDHAAARFWLTQLVTPTMVYTSYMDAHREETTAPPWLTHYMNDPALELVVQIRRTFRCVSTNAG